ncbi:transcription initiation factor IIA subunit 2-like [Tropilaelaps mercedesae]|uniref:Transcription initiation factor IIA subunit 2 n=1 Tax=Tropilaelaps mercedesae TaxID=418985 RepID=A0A1V9XUQ1_9ACAR|nr:transcription initiation factor IIA subunit 2-like [Tropilaelaps mercedesae]
MSYQLYRNTTLGNCLQEALDELLSSSVIPEGLALRVLQEFDRAINHALANRVRSRLSFKAGHLVSYRFCDNVWTFVMKDVEFREGQELARAERLKIVACEARAQGS